MEEPYNQCLNRTFMTQIQDRGASTADQPTPPAYLRPKDLHETDPSVDTGVGHWLEAFWRDDAHG